MFLILLSLLHFGSSPNFANENLSENHSLQQTLPLQAFTGTWRTSSCSNCSLVVSQVGNQLYGELLPWVWPQLPRAGLEPFYIIGNRLTYRGDDFYISIVPIINQNRNEIVLQRATQFNRFNIVEARKVLEVLPPPPPPVCPPGTRWDPVLRRCVALPPPPPPQHLWTCSIYQFRASNFDRNSAIRDVLHQCALSSGGYVCRAAQVVCR